MTVSLARTRVSRLRTLLSVLFMAIVAVAVAEAAQIVGVLLVFTLMVGPAAASQRLTTGVGAGIALTVLLALAETWVGITLAYYTDWPTSFWIAALSGLAYFASMFPGMAARGAV
jgi:zinc/manganese transport system permease protein